MFRDRKVREIIVAEEIDSRRNAAKTLAKQLMELK